MDPASDRLRNAILVDAIVEPIDLGEIDWRAKQQFPSASSRDRQERVIDVMRSLVAGGLMEVGHLAKDDGFTVERLDAAIEGIRQTYVSNHGDAGQWMWSYYLKLTDDGWSAATATPEGRGVAQQEQERLAANAEAKSSTEG